MALVDRLMEARSRVINTAVGFGLPTYIEVTLLLPTGNLILSPRPKVTSVDPRRIGQWLTANVQLLGDELLIAGVSRVYSEAQLKEAEYLIAYPEGTKTCQFMSLDDRLDLTWSVIVRPYEVE